MRIGITCYPTYGGSGVVATELGMELATRGHDVHFISYAPPIRMNPADPHIFFHEVDVSSYPLFDHSPYTLTLATKMLEVFESASLDILHVHYAISKYLLNQTIKEFDIKRPIEVIPNFVNCDVYTRAANGKFRAQIAPGGEPILMHLSNFRPVKRVTD